MTRIFIIVFTLFMPLSNTWASDHIDGPVTMKHRVADLSDLYAFSDSTNNENLNIVLNTYPLVASNGHFDSKVFYRIHINKLSPDSLQPINETGSLMTIECRFITPLDHHNHHTPHQSICSSNNGLKAKSTFNKVSEGTESMRVFHGMRSDPFFFNSDWAKSAIKGKINPPAKSNTMDSINVLSIVHCCPV